ncbi:MAG: PQQ-binding-like beta-propeller repeat protein [Caldisericia bacterium]|nr:PQQ-binding-like beta-propeller repeat protein [Caldisericia bacterium]
MIKRFLPFVVFGLFLTLISSVHAVDYDYFGVVWSKTAGDHHFGLVIDNGYLYTSDYNGLFCINIETGETKWCIKTEFEPYNAVFRNVDNNPKLTKTTISFITTMGIYGYDKATGKQKWFVSCKPKSDLSNPVNNISIINFFDKICLIDLEKGTFIRTIPLKDSVGQDRIVFRNKNFAVFVNYTHIVILDLVNNDIFLSELLPEPCHFKPVPLFDGNMLYYYSRKDKQVMVNCYDLVKRTIVWSQNIDFQSNMLISGNKLVAGKVCLDKNNGKILWKNDQIDFSSVNCLCDDRITAFLDNGDYVIFKLDTGEITCKDTRLEELGDDRSISSFPIYHKGNIYMTTGSAIYKFGANVSTVSVTVGSNYSLVGKQKVFIDDKPFVKNGALYINPVTIIEPLGGRVGGFSTKQYKNCIYNDKVVRLLKTKSDSKDNNVIDGCIEVNNTIFVPLRKLTDAFNLKLKWDTKTKTATITK